MKLWNTTKIKIENHDDKNHDLQNIKSKQLMKARR